MSITLADEPPSPSAAQKALDFPLYDSTGKRLTLRRVLSQSTTQSPISSHPCNQRVLLIFIRHFLCGNCQEYLRRLSSTFSSLSSASNVSIAVIGCGSPTLIPSYLKLTQCHFPIFSDPSSRLYSLLGMHRSLALGPKAPEYIQHSLLKIAMGSIVQGLKRLPQGDMMKSGEWVVNGGEFLFEAVSGTPGMEDEDGGVLSWRLKWCHRMRNTRDHAEMSDLRTVLGTNESMGSADAKAITRKSQCDEVCVEPPRVQRRSTSVRRSLSLRRQSWSNAVANLGRSISVTRRDKSHGRQRPMAGIAEAGIGRGRTVAVG